jgi:hypothetical protein
MRKLVVQPPNRRDSSSSRPLTKGAAHDRCIRAGGMVAGSLANTRSLSSAMLSVRRGAVYPYEYVATLAAAAMSDKKKIQRLIWEEE